jgi:L-asparaginase II
MAGTPVQLAEIVRSDFVEGHHYGSVVAVDIAGKVTWELGAVDSPMLPRSSNKPLQALGMVRSGLHLSPQLLALACGSHSGEPQHIHGVQRILASAGLTEEALQTPPDFPLDDMERVHALSHGRKTRVAMNCSGKHAAMLATCVANGWSTDDYLSVDHPVQIAIADAIADLSGEPIAHRAVDGCGAPLLAISLAGLARAFGRLASSTDGDERKIATAILTYPEMVSGTRRDEARLIRAIPGAIAKAGAESVYAVGLPDGRAVAIKCDDGAIRARPVLMAAALERLGVLDEPGVDADAVRATGDHPLMGGGLRVGEIRATF